MKSSTVSKSLPGAIELAVHTLNGDIEARSYRCTVKLVLTLCCPCCDPGNEASVRDGVRTSLSYHETSASIALGLCLTSLYGMDRRRST